MDICSPISAKLLANSIEPCFFLFIAVSILLSMFCLAIFIGILSQNTHFFTTLLYCKVQRFTQLTKRIDDFVSIVGK